MNVFGKSLFFFQQAKVKLYFNNRNAQEKSDHVTHSDYTFRCCKGLSALKWALSIHDDQPPTDCNVRQKATLQWISSASFTFNGPNRGTRLAETLSEKKVLSGEMRAVTAGVTRAHLLCWFWNSGLFFVFLILVSVPSPKYNYRARFRLKILFPQPTGLFDRGCDIDGRCLAFPLRSLFRYIRYYFVKNIRNVSDLLKSTESKKSSNYAIHCSQFN